MTDIIGIDLGTTSSTVAVYRDGRPVVVTTQDGPEVPSLVSFNRNGEPGVGHRARLQTKVYPADTVYSVKRLLGRRFDDPVVQQVRKQQPQIIRRGEDGGVVVMTTASGRTYSPEELVAMILRQLRLEAETYLGSTVTRAVLAVPAHFSDRQRHAAREAGRLAGLDIVRVINEPTAAALAYGAQRDGARRLLVVDLGGGHYDVSLVESDGGAVRVFASHGDPGLGGEDWDAAVSDYLAAEFLKFHGVALKQSPHAVHRLRKAAEEARIALSGTKETTISLPFIISGMAGPRHLNMILTRAQFEARTATLNERLPGPMERVMADAAMLQDAARQRNVDSVLLIGGCARMPTLQNIVKRVVGDAPIEIPENGHLVAMGAALQAAQLAGETDDVTLRDVTPLSLGLETMGGLMTPLIPRNTPIPVKRSEIFSTIEDDQTEVEIHVLQGERSMASDNSKLGVFHLRGIPPAPRGVPQIEVTFEVDPDGILHVEARDMASGSCHELHVTTGEALAGQDVQRMVEEAASCELEDMEKRALIEAQNLGRQILYQTERCLQHLDGMSDRADCDRKRKEIRQKLEALEQALDGKDMQEIQQLTGEIQEASMILNHLVYDKDGRFDGRIVRKHEKEGEGPESRGGKHTEIVVEPI